VKKPDAGWGKLIDGKKCVRTSDLCELFGISDVALAKWAANGCPKAKYGWWPLAEVLRWRGLVGTSGVKTEQQAVKLSYREQKLRAEAELKRTTADREAIKLSEIKGEYLPVAEVKRHLQALFMSLRRSLLSLGKVAGMEAAAHVDAAAARRIEQAVREVVTDGLEQLSQDGDYKPRKRKIRHAGGRPRKNRLA